MSKVTEQSLQKAYRRYARIYDVVFGAVFHPGRKTAIEHLHCQEGERILEVGVGTGLSLSLYPDFVKVVGIDLSQEMLQKACARVARLGLSHVEGLECMNAQNMTFPDNSFDKVAAMYVASVVPDPAQMMEEIRRVCKPGGLIVVLNHFQNENPAIRKGEEFLQRYAKTLGFFPAFSMEEFLTRTNFKVTTAIPVNLFNYWTVLVGYNDKK